MYQRVKLTLSKRVTISPNSIVELEVNETIEIPKSPLGEQQRNYGKFYLRKSFAVQGLLQYVHTPLPEGFNKKPTVVVKNDHVAPIELLQGEEVGELWIFTE